MPFLDRDGVAINYEVFGDGEPIVLVHGFASSLQGNWVTPGWVETLTPVRRVIALDCRGHGESDKPHEPDAYASDAMSGDVIAVMDHLDIATADLFGYSMGGGIALRLLVAHPQRFTRAIVGGVGERQTRAARDESIARGMEGESDDPVAAGFRVFAERNDNDLKALAAMRRAPRPRGGGGNLASISAPVLIVNGADDRVVGSPDRIASAIPNARLVTIPGRDHLTLVPDQRFKDAVLDFLAQR